MPTVKRSVFYGLLTAVLALLLGITALLGVAHNRRQRLEDVTIDLQRNLTQKESAIMELQRKLEDCDTLNAEFPNDQSWNRRQLPVMEAPATDKW